MTTYRATKELIDLVLHQACRDIFEVTYKLYDAEENDDAKQAYYTIMEIIVEFDDNHELFWVDKENDKV